MSKHMIVAAAGLCLMTGALVHAQAKQAADSRRYIQPRTQADAALPPFSGGVWAGNTLYLAGQIGTDAQNRVPDTAEAEAKAVLDKVQDLLKAGGLTMDDLVSVTVF